MPSSPCEHRAWGCVRPRVATLLLILATQSLPTLAANEPVPSGTPPPKTTSPSNPGPAPTPANEPAPSPSAPIERPFTPSEQVSPDQEVDFPADL